MSGTVGFSGNTRGGQGEVMKKKLSGDEAVAAWGGLLEEVVAVGREWGDRVEVRPERLAVDLRGGGTVQQPDEPVQLLVTLPTPIHRAKNVGKWMECEVFFHLPRGYPAVPPVEQGEGDIDINMVGFLSKHSMRVLAREIHLQVISRYEEAKSALGYPTYIKEVLNWVHKTDLPDFVASKVIGKPGRGVRRTWARFHHVVSKVKSAYGLMWAKDHGIRGVLGGGQPAFTVAEGRPEDVDAYIQKFTEVLHWGPIPSEVLLTTYPDPTEPPLSPLALITTSHPQCVVPSGTFNGRDCIDYPRLAALFSTSGHASAAAELGELLPVYHHDNGHVDAEAVSVAVSEAKSKKPDPPPSAPSVKKKGKAKKRLQ